MTQYYGLEFVDYANFRWNGFSLYQTKDRANKEADWYRTTNDRIKCVNILTYTLITEHLQD
jgi:hypothetical protein